LLKLTLNRDHKAPGRGIANEHMPMDSDISQRSNCNARVKTQLTMLRFNGLVNRIGGPTDAGELVLV